jgi:hypothetical protein
MAPPHPHMWFPLFPLVPLAWIALWAFVVSRVVRVMRRRRTAFAGVRSGGPEAGRTARWDFDRDPGGEQRADAGIDHARALLAERFAKGEIDEDEYWSRRTVLDATDNPRV